MLGRRRRSVASEATLADIPPKEEMSARFATYDSVMREIASKAPEVYNKPAELRVFARRIQDIERPIRLSRSPVVLLEQRRYRAVIQQLSGHTGEQLKAYIESIMSVPIEHHVLNAAAKRDLGGYNSQYEIAVSEGIPAYSAYQFLLAQQSVINGSATQADAVAAMAAANITTEPYASTYQILRGLSESGVGFDDATMASQAVEVCKASGETHQKMLSFVQKAGALLTVGTPGFIGVMQGLYRCNAEKMALCADIMALSQESFTSQELFQQYATAVFALPPERLTDLKTVIETHQKLVADATMTYAEAMEATRGCVVEIEPMASTLTVLKAIGPDGDWKPGLDSEPLEQQARVLCAAGPEKQKPICDVMLLTKETFAGSPASDAQAFCEQVLQQGVTPLAKMKKFLTAQQALAAGSVRYQDAWADMKTSNVDIVPISTTYALLQYLEGQALAQSLDDDAPADSGWTDAMLTSQSRVLCSVSIETQAQVNTFITSFANDDLHQTLALPLLTKNVADMTACAGIIGQAQGRFPGQGEDFQRFHTHVLSMPSAQLPHLSSALSKLEALDVSVQAEQFAAMNTVLEQDPALFTLLTRSMAGFEGLPELAHAEPFGVAWGAQVKSIHKAMATAELSAACSSGGELDVEKWSQQILTPVLATICFGQEDKNVSFEQTSQWLKEAQENTQEKLKEIREHHLLESEQYSRLYLAYVAQELAQIAAETNPDPLPTAAEYIDSLMTWDGKTPPLMVVFINLGAHPCEPHQQGAVHDLINQVQGFMTVTDTDKQAKLLHEAVLEARQGLQQAAVAVKSPTELVAEMTDTAAALRRSVNSAIRKQQSSMWRSSDAISDGGDSEDSEASLGTSSTGLEVTPEVELSVNSWMVGVCRHLSPGIALGSDTDAQLDMLQRLADLADSRAAHASARRPAQLDVAEVNQLHAELLRQYASLIGQRDISLTDYQDFIEGAMRRIAECRDSMPDHTTTEMLASGPKPIARYEWGSRIEKMLEAAHADEPKRLADWKLTYNRSHDASAPCMYIFENANKERAKFWVSPQGNALDFEIPIRDAELMAEMMLAANYGEGCVMTLTDTMMTEADLLKLCEVADRTGVQMVVPQQYAKYVEPLKKVHNITCETATVASGVKLTDSQQMVYGKLEGPADERDQRYFFVGEGKQATASFNLMGETNPPFTVVVKGKTYDCASMLHGVAHCVGVTTLEGKGIDDMAPQELAEAWVKVGPQQLDPSGVQDAMMRVVRARANKDKVFANAIRDNCADFVVLATDEERCLPWQQGGRDSFAEAAFSEARRALRLQRDCGHNAIRKLVVSKPGTGSVAVEQYRRQVCGYKGSFSMRSGRRYELVDLSQNPHLPSLNDNRRLLTLEGGSMTALEAVTRNQVGFLHSAGHLDTAQAEDVMAQLAALGPEATAADIQVDIIGHGMVSINAFAEESGWQASPEFCDVLVKAMMSGSDKMMANLLATNKERKPTERSRRIIVTEGPCAIGHGEMSNPFGDALMRYREAAIAQSQTCSASAGRRRASTASSTSLVEDVLDGMAQDPDLGASLSADAELTGVAARGVMRAGHAVARTVAAVEGLDAEGITQVAKGATAVMGAMASQGGGEALAELESFFDV